jgi:hypothetical protein
LDVEGLASMYAMRKRWQAGSIREFDWSIFLRTWSGGPEFGHYTYARARKVAAHLVATCGE